MPRPYSLAIFFHRFYGWKCDYFYETLFYNSVTTRFFYKRKLYKNIEAGKPLNFKNIVKMSWGWDARDQKNIFSCNFRENSIKVLPNLHYIYQRSHVNNLQNFWYIESRDRFGIRIRKNIKARNICISRMTHLRISRYQNLGWEYIKNISGSEKFLPFLWKKHA